MCLGTLKISGDSETGSLKKHIAIGFLFEMFIYPRFYDSGPESFCSLHRNAVKHV